MGGGVLIIGGGLSGLSCGYHLGEKCKLLEKNSYIGGLSSTKEHMGFRFDLGGHRFFTDDIELNLFFKDLLNPSLLEVVRKSTIYWKNQFIDYPLKPSIVYIMNPFESLTSIFTYFLRHIFPLKGDSFESTSINRFGDRLYSMFFKKYTQKVWGLNGCQLSSELADTRLQNISLWRVLKNFFLPSKTIKSFTDTFFYPQTGIGHLSDVLSADLDIHLNSKVVGLVCDKKKIIKAVVEDGTHYELDTLVSTMPLNELVSLLNPPEDVLKHAEKLMYRDLICVFISLDIKRYSDNHWIYFPDKQIFGRIHEPKNWSPKMAVKDKTGLCIEIFCSRKDSVWDYADAQIVDSVVDELPAVDKKNVLGSKVVRVENAYPIYELGYKKHLDKVTEYISSFENLYLLGRTGGFRYENMDYCMKEGLELGEKILGETK